MSLYLELSMKSTNFITKFSLEAEDRDTGKVYNEEQLINVCSVPIRATIEQFELSKGQFIDNLYQISNGELEGTVLTVVSIDEKQVVWCLHHQEVQDVPLERTRQLIIDCYQTNDHPNTRCYNKGWVRFNDLNEEEVKIGCKEPDGLGWSSSIFKLKYRLY